MRDKIIDKDKATDTANHSTQQNRLSEDLTGL